MPLRLHTLGAPAHVWTGRTRQRKLRASVGNLRAERIIRSAADPAQSRPWGLDCQGKATLRIPTSPQRTSRITSTPRVPLGAISRLSAHSSPRTGVAPFADVRRLGVMERANGDEQAGR